MTQLQFVPYSLQVIGWINKEQLGGGEGVGEVE
jgi:hypothetical protein